MAYQTFHIHEAAPEALALAPAAPRSREAEPKFLLELMVADLQWSSMQIAMLGLTATACAAPDGRFSLRPLRHLVYGDPCVMRLALRYADNIGIAAQASQKLDRLYSELSLVTKQVAPLVDHSLLSAAHRQQLTRLLPALNKLASIAAEALKAFEPAIRSQLNPNYLHDNGVIENYLARAAHGELTASERSGELGPPALKQRRSSPRAAVNKPCRLAFAGGEVEAILVDISRNGLGLNLNGQAPVAVKQAVTVMVGERALEAEVVRRSGLQIGLMLKRPVSITDPLYRAD